MRSREWIMSAGGPLIITNIEAAPYWGGVLALKSAEPPFMNDYEKACDFETYLAQVHVGHASALLLGGAPLDTCFWQDDHGAIFLVRVWFCEQNFDVDIAMSRLPSSLFKNTTEKLRFTVEYADFIMFDSAEPGDDDNKFVVVTQIPRGTYNILTQAYEPDAETSLVLHRFDRLGA